jgi:hypothetical protein
MFRFTTPIQAHKVLLSANETLLNLKKDQRMTLEQQKNEVLGIIKSIGALRAKPECSSQTNSLAALFFLTDAYSHLSLLYNRMHSVEHPMIEKAEKALDQAIMCLDLIEDLSKKTTVIIDNEFVKRCNTFGICDVNEARKAIKDNLIPLLIQNTEEKKCDLSCSTAESDSIKKSI